METQWFYNYQRLFVNILIRDKLRILIWVASVTLFTVIVGAAFLAIYSDPIELQSIAEVMKNPAMVLMFGPVFGEDNYTVAVAMSNQMLVFSMLIMGIMSIFVVTRYTRADEEEGILELIRSLPVGRLANTVAVILLLIIMNVLVGTMIGFGLWIVPEASYTFIGSLTYGFACSASGIFIGAITLIIVQLFENNRIVMGSSFLILGILYIGRGLADISESFLIWLIPFNWPIRSQVYVENLFWLNVLTIVMSLGLIVIALYLNVRRDLETGVFPQKKGRYFATNLLGTPLGFTLRLLKTGIIAWVFTLFVLGITYGAIFGDLDAFIQSNDVFNEMLPGGEYALTVQFMSVIMVVMAVIAGIGPIMFMNRLAVEERKNHTEHLYARAISRTKIFLTYLGIAAISAILLLYLGALGMYVGIVGSMDDPMEFQYIIQSASAYIPALLFMVGLSALFVGAFPKISYLIWLYFGYSFFAVYMGQVIGLPAFFEQLTPYGYIAQLPIESFTPLSAMVLTVMAIILSLLGHVIYRKRDLLG